MRPIDLEQQTLGEITALFTLWKEFWRYGWREWRLSRAFLNL